MYSEFDLFYRYGFSGAVITIGLVLGFGIVAHFVYKPSINQITQEGEDLDDKDAIFQKEVARYIALYDEDYNKLVDGITLTDNRINELAKIYTSDITPYGEISMCFSNDSESFNYWADKQIPYKVLECVAKKYVVENDCKCIYVDIKKELEKQHEELNEKMEQNKTTANENENEDKVSEDDKNDNDSVFVKFKKYKTPAKSKKVTASKKPVIVCDRANRYTYRGTFNEYKKLSVTQVANEVKPIDYNSFKASFNTAKLAWGVKSKCDDDLIDGVWRFLDVKSNELLYDCSSETETETVSENKNNVSSNSFSFNGKQFTSADDLQKYVNINLITDSTQSANNNNVNHNINNRDGNTGDSLFNNGNGKLAKGEYSLNGVRFATSGKLHKYFNSQFSTNNDSGSSNYCSDDEQFEKVTDMDGYLYDFSKNKTVPESPTTPKINISGGGVLINKNKKEKETGSWLYW